MQFWLIKEEVWGKRPNTRLDPEFSRPKTSLIKGTEVRKPGLGKG
jgi:hypothetical protein